MAFEIRFLTEQIKRTLISQSIKRESSRGTRISRGSYFHPKGVGENSNLIFRQVLDAARVRLLQRFFKDKKRV